MDSSVAVAPSTTVKFTPAAAEPSTTEKSSPDVAAPSIATKSSPAPASKVVQLATLIPIVVDDVISPSLTTLGGASHTPSFFDNSTTSMDVEDVKHGIGEVHKSSLRNTGSIGCGSRGGRPPQSKRAKTISKPFVAWDHFTRDETSFQDESMTHCNYCGTGYKCHPKINGTSSMLYHVGNCQKYKSHEARQD